MSRRAWQIARLAAGLTLATAACSEEVVFHADDPWADTREYPTRGVVVTNSLDDTITWLDPDQGFAPVLTEPVGRIPPEREGPHHGTALPDGSAYFIGLSNYIPGSGSGPHGAHGTGQVDGYLLKYDTLTHRLLAETRVDRSPGDVRIVPDGSVVLQSHFDLVKVQDALEEGTGEGSMNSTLAVVDAATMERRALIEICPTGHGIGVAPGSDTAYVSCSVTDELAQVSLEPPYGVTRIPLGAAAVVPPAMMTHEPYSVTVAPDGNVWVSALKTGLQVYDPVAGSWVMGPIDVGGAPYFGDFSADGSLFVVPVQGNPDALVFVNTADGTVDQSLALPDEACELPHGALFTPDETRVLVVCEGNHVTAGTVAVVTTAPRAVEAYHTVGVFPDDLVWVEGQ